MAMMTQEQALLALVLEHPAEDAPRLVYADWCEEQGLCNRAEFIRIQLELARGSPRQGEHPECHCHAQEPGFLCGPCLVPKQRCCALQQRAQWLLDDVPPYSWADVPPLPFAIRRAGVTDLAAAQYAPVATFRRGFVAEVALPLNAWLGAPCPGSGHSGAVEVGACLHCDGTGRIGGAGVELVRWQPVERVRFTDREPEQVINQWWNAGDVRGNRFFVPDELFRLLGGFVTRHATGKGYSDADLAHAALGLAGLRWAKGERI